MGKRKTKRRGEESAASSALATIAKTFKVLPVQYSGYCKYLYYKEHRAAGLPRNMIFVANPGAAATESWLKSVFEKAFSRPVKAVYIGSAPSRKISDQNTTCKIARLEFNDEDSVRAVMRGEVPGGGVHGSNVPASSSGMDDWIRDYNSERPSVEEMRREADERIDAFHNLETEELNSRKQRESTPDDDGFITVSYKNSAKRRIGDPHDTQAKKRRKRTELQNFYSFQKREAKRGHLETLRAKFEKDKLRIQRLKAARKFKPF